MSCTPSAVPFWPYNLRQNLAGSFTARARGLFAPEFVLLGPGEEEFGRLCSGGIGDAQVRAEGFVAAFETSGRRYSMAADGREILTAHPKGHSTESSKSSVTVELTKPRSALSATSRSPRNSAVKRQHVSPEV